MNNNKGNIINTIHDLKINKDMKEFFLYIYHSFSEYTDLNFINYKKELLNNENLYFETLDIFSFYKEEEKEEYLRFYEILKENFKI